LGYTEQERSGVLTLINSHVEEIEPEQLPSEFRNFFV